MPGQERISLVFGRATAAIPLAAFLLWSLSAQAQLAGHNTRGDYGLQSGTQAPPGVYAVGMLYDYSADTLRDRDGDSLPPDSSGGSVGARAAIAGLQWISDKTILGGNYGLAVFPGVTNNAVEAPALQTDTQTSTGFADLYIQPVILGWTTQRADFTAGLGIYAPTGKYDAEGDDNRGLGMWSYELFGGTTVYFDEAKTWHLAANAFYETHGEQEQTVWLCESALFLGNWHRKHFGRGDFFAYPDVSYSQHPFTMKRCDISAISPQLSCGVNLPRSLLP